MTPDLMPWFFTIVKTCPNCGEEKRERELGVGHKPYDPKKRIRHVPWFHYCK